MSRRIMMTLAMINGILDENPTTIQEVRGIRNRIKDRLAEEFDVQDHQTIQDKFTRQFGRIGVGEFDRLVLECASGNPTNLRTICLEYCVDDEDRILVNQILTQVDADDDELSNEFGMNANSREFNEGRIRLKLHKFRERDKGLVRDAKRQWYQEMNGDIRCRVCGISFKETYGTIGDGFIEAHHLVPISELDGDTPTTISDLAPVCANCHRMIHRVNPMIHVDEFRLRYLD